EVERNRQRHPTPRLFVRHAPTFLLPVLERQFEPAPGTLRHFPQRTPLGHDSEHDRSGVVWPRDAYRLLLHLLLRSAGLCRRGHGAGGRNALGCSGSGWHPPAALGLADLRVVSAGRALLPSVA